VSCAKTAEPIEMPFGLWAWMGPRNHVLDWSRQVLRDVAMATNFGTQFAITGFVGYNFGCMIASGTLFDSRGGFLGSNYLMKRRCHGKHFWFLYTGCTLAPPGEYDWTVRVRRQCGLMSNYLTTCYY